MFRQTFSTSTRVGNCLKSKQNRLASIQQSNKRFSTKSITTTTTTHNLCSLPSSLLLHQPTTTQQSFAQQALHFEAFSTGLRANFFENQNFPPVQTPSGGHTALEIDLGIIDTVDAPLSTPSSNTDITAPAQDSSIDSLQAIKRTYQPSKVRRRRKHGFLKRISVSLST